MPRLHRIRFVTCVLVLGAITTPLFAGAQGTRQKNLARPVPARATLEILRDWFAGGWMREICHRDEGEPCRLLTPSLPEAIDAGCLIDPHGASCPG